MLQEPPGPGWRGPPKSRLKQPFCSQLRKPESGEAPAVHVRLDLRQGDAEHGGNVLVRLFVEVKEHERHPLMVRQAAQGSFEPCLPIGLVIRVSGSTNGAAGTNGTVSPASFCRSISLKSCQRARCRVRWLRHRFVVTVLSQPATATLSPTSSNR